MGVVSGGVSPTISNQLRPLVNPLLSRRLPRALPRPLDLSSPPRRDDHPFCPNLPSHSRELSPAPLCHARGLRPVVEPDPAHQPHKNPLFPVVVKQGKSTQLRRQVHQGVGWQTTPRKCPPWPHHGGNGSPRPHPPTRRPRLLAPPTVLQRKQSAPLPRAQGQPAIFWKLLRSLTSRTLAASSPLRPPPSPTPPLPLTSPHLHRYIGMTT
jgi:hypothetical protein